MTVPLPRNPSPALLSLVRGELLAEIAAPADVVDTRSLTYSVDEVAALLGVARGTAYEQVQNGVIPAVRLGRRWLIPRARFHTWLNGKAS
jgi:excisionase family DNA binding protein